MNDDEIARPSNTTEEECPECFGIFIGIVAAFAVYIIILSKLLECAKRRRNAANGIGVLRSLVSPPGETIGILPLPYTFKTGSSDKLCTVYPQLKKASEIAHVIGFMVWRSQYTIKRIQMASQDLRREQNLNLLGWNESEASDLEAELLLQPTGIIRRRLRTFLCCCSKAIETRSDIPLPLIRDFNSVIDVIRKVHQKTNYATFEPKEYYYIKPMITSAVENSTNRQRYHEDSIGSDDHLDKKPVGWHCHACRTTEIPSVFRFMNNRFTHNPRLCQELLPLLNDYGEVEPAALSSLIHSLVWFLKACCVLPWDEVNMLARPILAEKTLPQTLKLLHDRLQPIASNPVNVYRVNVYFESLDEAESEMSFDHQSAKANKLYSEVIFEDELAGVIDLPLGVFVQVFPVLLPRVKRCLDEFLRAGEFEISEEIESKIRQASSKLEAGIKASFELPSFNIGPTYDMLLSESMEMFVYSADSERAILFSHPRKVVNNPEDCDLV